MDDTNDNFLFRFVMTPSSFFTNTIVQISTMDLILNHTTLFYYNISSTKMNKMKYGPVANWATQVKNSYQSLINVKLFLARLLRWPGPSILICYFVQPHQLQQLLPTA